MIWLNMGCYQEKVEKCKDGKQCIISIAQIAVQKTPQMYYQKELSQIYEMGLGLQFFITNAIIATISTQGICSLELER